MNQIPKPIKPPPANTAATETEVSPAPQAWKNEKGPPVKAPRNVDWKEAASEPVKVRQTPRKMRRVRR